MIFPIRYWLDKIFILPISSTNIIVGKQPIIIVWLTFFMKYCFFLVVNIFVSPCKSCYKVSENYCNNSSYWTVQTNFTSEAHIWEVISLESVKVFFINVVRVVRSIELMMNVLGINHIVIVPHNCLTWNKVCYSADSWRKRNIIIWLSFHFISLTLETVPCTVVTIPAQVSMVTLTRNYLKWEMYLNIVNWKLFLWCLESDDGQSLETLFLWWAENLDIASDLFFISTELLDWVGRDKIETKSAKMEKRVKNRFLKLPFNVKLLQTFRKSKNFYPFEKSEEPEFQNDLKSSLCCFWLLLNDESKK